MKFAKKNSSVIVGIIVFIAVLVGIFTVKSILSSDEPVAFYGTRLEGRKDVEISNDKKNKIKDKLKDNKVSIRVAGRIINVTIKVNADTTLDSAKELGNKILEEYLTSLNNSKPPIIISSQSGERLSSVIEDSPKTLAEAKKLVDKMFS